MKKAAKAPTFIEFTPEKSKIKDNKIRKSRSWESMSLEESYKCVQVSKNDD